MKRMIWCCQLFDEANREGGIHFSETNSRPLEKKRSFRGILEQRKFRLTLQQLRSPDDGELLGEAMSESIIQGL